MAFGLRNATKIKNHFKIDSAVRVFLNRSKIKAYLCGEISVKCSKEAKEDKDWRKD